MKVLYAPSFLPSLKWNKGFREVLLFISVSVFYKVSRFIAIGDAETAFNNAYLVVNFEKSLGIFNEIAVQQFFLGKTSFVRFCNQFYTAVHVPSIILFFFFLYQKHRHYYYYIRNCFLLANFCTLFVFIAFPCAPPRMLNELGFVDTLLEISKVNLYNGPLVRFFNQYAAMPSMHFGTSMLIGITSAIFVKNKALKVLLLAYPWYVLLVIVATGNHFFLDAIVGGLITAIPFAFTLKRKLAYPTVVNLMVIEETGVK